MAPRMRDLVSLPYRLYWRKRRGKHDQINLFVLSFSDAYPLDLICLGMEIIITSVLSTTTNSSTNLCGPAMGLDFCRKRRKQKYNLLY